MLATAVADDLTAELNKYGWQISKGVKKIDRHEMTYVYLEPHGGVPHYYMNDDIIAIWERVTAYRCNIPITAHKVKRWEPSPLTLMEIVDLLAWLYNTIGKYGPRYQ